MTLQERIKSKIDKLNECESRCAALRFEIAVLRRELPPAENVPHCEVGAATESIYSIVVASGEQGVAFWGIKEALPEFKNMNLRVAIQRLVKRGLVKTVSRGRGTLRIYPTISQVAAE